MLLIGGAAMRAWPMSIDIGSQDTRFVSGFHEPEQFDAMRFRWSAEASELHIPRPPAGPALLSLRMLNGYPEGVPAPQLRVLADEHDIGSFALSGREGGLRRYRLLVPVDTRLDWATHIRLVSTSYVPPGDPRQLGAVVDQVQFDASTHSSVLPAALTLLSSFLFGSVLFLALNLMGLGRIPALLFVLGISLVLALAAALRPLEVLPFLQRLAALPMIACLALVLIRGLLPVEQSRQASSVGPYLSGEYLPAMFAIVWWMLPVFQAVQIWDGASIGVGIETFQLGGITLALVLAGLLLSYGYSRARPVEQRRMLIARAVLIALALGAAIHLGNALAYAFTRSGKDFWILFKGTRDWVQGGSFYDLQAVMTNHVGAVFKVPPFYGMLFAPFVFQDGLQILLYHRLINVGLMLATALVWLRMFRVRPIWWGLSAIVIILNSRPLADTIAFGQIDLMLLFLLSCALWAMRAGDGARGSGGAGDTRQETQDRRHETGGTRQETQDRRRETGDTRQETQDTRHETPDGERRAGAEKQPGIHAFAQRPSSSMQWGDMLAGALIALGALFKVYPVILLAFFVIKRRWYGLLGFTLGMLIYNGLALAVVGWEMHRVYLFEVLPKIGGTTSWVENQTISGFLARLSDAPFDAHLFENRPLALLGTMLSGLLSLGACLLVFRPAPGRSTSFALQYCQFLLLMVLAVPAAWMHYETLLVLVFGVLLLHLRERKLALFQASMLALSFALISYGNQWSFNGTTVMGVLTIVGISYKFYGMLILAGLMGMFLLEPA